MPNPLTLTDVKAQIDRVWDKFTEGYLTPRDVVIQVAEIMDAVEQLGIEA